MILGDKISCAMPPWQAEPMFETTQFSDLFPQLSSAFSDTSQVFTRREINFVLVSNIKYLLSQTPEQRSPKAKIKFPAMLDNLPPLCKNVLF